MNSSQGITLNIDWELLIPVVILIILSLTTLFSINISLFKSQFIFLILSFFAFIFFSQVHYRIIQLYAVPIYIISILLLLIVLFIGIESRGAVRWIDIFGLKIQFSEILKPFFAISFSAFLVNKKIRFSTLLSSLSFVLPIVFLIYLQPDLGNAVIYLMVYICTVIVFGFPLLWFGIGALCFSAIVPILWRFLHDYQKQRIATFIHPTNDPLGTSYNAIQSIIAIGSGMFSGKGLSESTQSGLRFLPERHTDFIFATLSEGLGFIGSVLVIIAFGILLYKIYTIFNNSDDIFCKTFVLVAFSFILVQFFLNIGMNIGILPVVGITLPFVSYGGSSLLSNFILLGLLSSVNTATKREKVLEIR